MPIYEYRCSSCGHELEALQKLSEAPLTTCPACSHEALVKLMSAAGFQLKGSGWYATDFKSSGKAPSKPADGKAADGKAADGKTADGKAADAKASDAKVGDGKAGDAKSGESKSDTKSEAAAAPSGGTKCACH